MSCWVFCLSLKLSVATSVGAGAGLLYLRLLGRWVWWIELARALQMIDYQSSDKRRSLAQKKSSSGVLVAADA